MPTSKYKTPAVIATELRAKGWSYRAAAGELGVHWAHLIRVLRGERHSASLLRRISALPQR
jgi:hypothetical protein